MERRTVLITGVAGRWGRRLARQLVKFPIVRVLGLDVRPPARPIEGVEYIEADLRNPLLVELLRQEKVEGILHMVFASGLNKDGETITSEESFQTNVMGTLELLAAANAAGVKQVVLKSTTMIYGARVDNPLYLAEDAPLRGTDGMPQLRQRYEIEKFVADFRRNHALKIAVLRFPGIIGASGASSLMRYLGQPAPPVLFGFDPLIQVVHEADVIGSILHAMAAEANGVFNIAADGVMPLSQLVRRVGRVGVPVFHPLAYGLRRLPGVRSAKLANQVMPFDLDYIRYSWVADTTKMHAELGYEPRHTAEEAVEAFRATLRLKNFADVVPGRRSGNDGIRAFLKGRRAKEEQL
ncbi:MAG TPA: NAD-dependent epimerase/dehydratase family protein [Herpetosiphonaceae bacterium]|nr:NAD-dependent epimerase/dehydratase family protein [Herpetosiphonaceae bacterium]